MKTPFTGRGPPGVFCQKGIDLMIFDASLGIDFKEGHLVLSLLKKSFRRIRLVDYAVHPLLPEAQKEEREAQMISQINGFVSKHEIDRQRISISIPRDKVVVRFVKLPIATKENLRKVLEYETPKYSPFEKEEVYFDYHILKEEKDWIRLFVVFVKKAVVDHYLALLKKIRIHPSSVQIPTTAVLNLFYYHGGNNKEGVSVLLDLTRPLSEVNVSQAKDLSERVHLPLASEDAQSRVIQDVKRFVLNGAMSAKPCFYVYGLEADEKGVGSLQGMDQANRVSFPPLTRIETEKKAVKPVGPEL